MHTSPALPLCRGRLIKQQYYHQLASIGAQYAGLCCQMANWMQPACPVLMPSPRMSQQVQRTPAARTKLDCTALYRFMRSTWSRASPNYNIGSGGGAASGRERRCWLACSAIQLWHHGRTPAHCAAAALTHAIPSPARPHAHWLLAWNVRTS